MQTVFNGIDCSQLLRKIEWFKRKYGENYSPFSGRKIPLVSMEDVKKLISLQKEMGEELLTQLNVNYSKRL